MNVAFPAERLDILSICTGGGGLDLGIGLALSGARAVCFVERDAFAAAHLVSEMEAGSLAQAPVWSDARTFDGRRFRGCVDGLIAGIPCQPHSLAGRRRGRLDARDLWQPTRRIIVQARPFFVLIENVSGMLSAGSDEIAGAERVWRDLLKLGFALEGGLFTAAEIGATHERERVFILAVADTGHRQLSAGAAVAHAEGRDCGAGSREGGPLEYRHGSPGAGGAMADAYGARPQGIGHGGCDPAGQTGLCGRAAVGLTALERRREGRAASEIRRGRRDSAGIADGAMADADIAVVRRQPSARQQPESEPDDGIGLFPPGPGAIRRWADILERRPEVEPAVRRMADGLAAARIDWLRLLGNGVVPLQAAYAFRVLATRLAASGSTGAARLVRLIDQGREVAT